MLRTKPDTGTAHTPGPWAATNMPWPEQIGCCPLVGRPFSIHRDVDHRNVAAATTFANARLIAAAPDMLAELKRLRLAYVNLMETGYDRIIALGGSCDPVDVMEAGDPAIRRVNEVIARAEGRQP